MSERFLKIFNTNTKPWAILDGFFAVWFAFGAILRWNMILPGWNGWWPVLPGWALAILSYFFASWSIREWKGSKR